jgi:glucosyl-3-phosphoglycerate synthase
VLTFVIPAHDEADTVAEVARQALAASGPGDRVVVADSASSDGTGEVARDAGAEVLAAPLGKGAAMEAAVRACSTEWICFLDADLVHSDAEIPALLGAAVRGTQAPQVVGDFSDGLSAVLTLTDGFYRPLVRGLFPEVADRYGSKPLTGFRGVRRSLLDLPFPRHYGVEAHINVTVALAVGAPEVIHLGRFDGKQKGDTARATEISDTLLDLGQRFGRLSPARRSEWERWADDVDEVARGWRSSHDQAGYRRALMDAASRPLPSST